MFLFAQQSGWCPLWSGWMWILPFLFLAICIVGMVLCSCMCCCGHWPSWSRQEKTGREDEFPHDIAKRRFAKGEITKEEYEDIKRTIA